MTPGQGLEVMEKMKAGETKSEWQNILSIEANQI